MGARLAGGSATAGRLRTRSFCSSTTNSGSLGPWPMLTRSGSVDDAAPTGRSCPVLRAAFRIAGLLLLHILRIM
jgi:hypothetical protein